MNETLNASISFICASRIHQQYWWRGISLQQDASAKGHIRGGGGRLLGHIYSSCQFIAVVPNSPGKFLLFDLPTVGLCVHEVKKSRHKKGVRSVFGSNFALCPQLHVCISLTSKTFSYFVIKISQKPHANCCKGLEDFGLAEPVLKCLHVPLN